MARFLKKFFPVAILISSLIISSCGKGDSCFCYKNGTYKEKKYAKKKNSKRSKGYQYKSAPVKKNYVVKNARKTRLP